MAAFEVIIEDCADYAGGASFSTGGSVSRIKRDPAIFREFAAPG